MKHNKLKVLFFDVETSPILASVWGLFDQNVGLNQIERDWSVLSYAAKWLGDKKIMYADNRTSKDIEDDKKLLQGIWNLLDEADVVIGQNSISFDTKKLNARFIKHGMGAPSPFKQIDTLRIAKKYFSFTSNKLEYLSSTLAPNAKKSSHKKYPGFEMWKSCIKGDKKAWDEMKAYNIQDIVALEAVYNELQKWDSSINFNIYHDKDEFYCTCGSDEFISKGYNYNSTGKFKRYKCKSCGKHYQSRINLLTKEKKQSLLK